MIVVYISLNKWNSKNYDISQYVKPAKYSSDSFIMSLLLKLLLYGHNLHHLVLCFGAFLLGFVSRDYLWRLVFCRFSLKTCLASLIEVLNVSNPHFEPLSSPFLKRFCKCQCARSKMGCAKKKFINSLVWTRKGAWNIALFKWVHYLLGQISCVKIFYLRMNVF